jgi:hypothetical protein
MKKIIANITLLALLVTPVASAFPLAANAVMAPNWNASGTYVINMNYLGTDYPHDMVLTQDAMGNLTGHGGSPAGANVYLWTINSGTVSGDTIDFTANYTATPDAVTPQTTIHVMGTIAPGGTMTGTWSDNYQGQQRAGTWASTSGNAVANPPVPPPQESVKVTIVKYIDGQLATATTAQNLDFPMMATWNAQNIGSGSGAFNLSASGYNGDTTPYQAMTVAMTPGGSYSVTETMNTNTGAACPTAGSEGGVKFMQDGYSVGNTLAEAKAATPMLAADLTNITSDKYIIVWNRTCNGTTGGISGDVVENQGMLHVDSVTVVKSSAIADGTFASGWKYVFHVTAPNNEPNLAMKFANWMSGSNTLPVANNMRISSMQASSSATVLLTAANTYSTPNLTMTSDLDSGTLGRQFDITVEVAVPTGTPTGSYTTTYGVQSTP